MWWDFFNVHLCLDIRIKHKCDPQHSCYPITFIRTVLLNNRGIDTDNYNQKGVIYNDATHCGEQKFQILKKINVTIKKRYI